MSQKESQGQAQLLFDFGPGSKPWRSIDDPVMGGRSQSRMLFEDGVAVFTGTVSLEAGGGFASVRSPVGEHSLAGFDGLRLRLRGDGKAYDLRLRTTSAFDGVSYRAALSPATGWSEVRIPWSAFKPVFRGREVRGHPPLDPAEIRTFGFLIAGGQAGPFRLEIDWIEAWAGED